jgi:hypothetical protein
VRIPALCTRPGCFERVLFGLGLSPVRWLCGDHGLEELELERKAA